MTGPTSHSELPPSSADKWFNCYGWRRKVDGLPNPSSAAAEEGTLAHEWFADHLLGTRDLSDCPDDEMADHLLMCVDWVETQSGIRHIEQRVDFGKPFGFEDLTGTSDLVLVHDDYLIVADLKYGKGVVEVEDNKQLLCYLVGAVNKHGRRPEYRLTILQPRAWHRHGLIRETRISNHYLLEFEHKLHNALKGSYNPRSELMAGPWCQHYCQAFGQCEAAAKKSLDVFRNTPQ
jgi:hypothetical protein